MPLYAVTSDRSALSPSTRRALHEAHDAMLCVGLAEQGGQVLDFLGTSRGLVTIVRTLQAVEAHASAAIEESDDDLERHRWQRAADTCGGAIRRVLADYERAVLA